MTELSIDAALAQLEALADAERAAQMAAYHKVPRRYLGLSNGQLDALVAQWRADATVEDRVRLADGLWSSGSHEAMIAAAKLLTQARIRPDDAVWALVSGWVPGFEGWAIADHACAAGSRRVAADPQRLDMVETWTTHDNMWTRRAALVITLPWARLSNPKPADTATRARVLGWAAGYVADRDWFIQKAIGWWLRDLSKHAPDMTRAWMADHGAGLKAFARREALRHLDT